MPKLLCPCGYVHNLSPIPDDGWETFRSKDSEQVEAAQRKRIEIAGDGLPSKENPQRDEWFAATRLILSCTGLLYECPQCGRLMWGKPKATPTDKRVYQVFVPEADSN